MKLVKIDGLANEVVSAQLERVFDVVKLRVGGDHDDGAGIAVLAQLRQHVEAAHVGQANIEQDEVGRLMRSNLQSGRAGLGLHHVIIPLFALLA
jgi:hypothetical protein